MSDLEEFRRQWEKELSHSRKRSDGLLSGSKERKPPPSPTTREVKNIDESDTLNIANDKDDFKVKNDFVLPYLVDSDSNSTENYHPFVIVDNLLKNGCSSKSTLEDRTFAPNKASLPNYFSFSQTPSNSSSTEKSNSENAVAYAKTLNAAKKEIFSPRKRKQPTDLSSSPQTYSKLLHEKKRKLLGESDTKERLLDRLISDLDEITEIPFFDIDLPRELALKIFQHLSLKDLCRCCQVSKAWKNLAEDELLWYRICVDLGESKSVAEGVNWKSHAQQCVTRAQTLITNWKSRVGSLQQFAYIKGGILCHVNSQAGRIVAGYTSGEVKMWEMRTEEECVFQPSSTSLMIDEGQEQGTLPNLIISVSTSEYLTSAAYSQGIVDVWQNTGVSTLPVYTITCPHLVTASLLSPDQPLIVTAYNSYVRTDLADKEHEFSQLEVLDVNQTVKRLALFKSPDPNQDVAYQVAICTSNIVWLHRPGQPSDSLTDVHNMIDAPISAIDVSSTLSQLAVGLTILGGPSNSCKVKLYDLDTGKLVTSLKGHTHYISCINLGQSPIHSLVTGCGDRRVRVFDVRCTSPVMTLTAHTQCVTQVQMDDWKVVSGGEDGLTCLWDQRMAHKLWDWHNRHPVRYSQFEDNQLIVANIPAEKFPQMDEFESVLHKRYRGSIQLYDFLSDQSREGLPENCLSNYDTAEGYDYNIRLTMPYDAV